MCRSRPPTTKSRSIAAPHVRCASRKEGVRIADGQLSTEDGLDTGLPRGMREPNGSGQCIVVGHSDGFETGGRSEMREDLGRDDAVAQRPRRMAVEMDEAAHPSVPVRLESPP